MNHAVLSFILMSLVIFSGCSRRVAGVAGGTKGILDCQGEKVGDIQLTLYEASETAQEPVGFAVTQADGTFELYKTGATGPLWLPAGKYRCTLESVGAPVQIPKAYLKPETTPLEITWTEKEQGLNVQGPPLKVRS